MLLRTAAALMLALAMLAGAQRAVAFSLPGFGAKAAADETLEELARALSMLALPEGHAAIAAAATEVGHWRLVNRSGELFTAAGTTELERGISTLAPEVSGRPERLRIYLTAASVFRYRASVHELPGVGALVLRMAGRDLAVSRSGIGRGLKVYVQMAPGLRVEASDRATFDEVASQLRRPVDRALVRTLALEPGGRTVIPPTPTIDVAARRASPDAIDPGHLRPALRGLKRQTVLVTGRLDRDRLVFKPSTGPDGALPLTEALRGAADGDVDLIVLATTSSRQPGSLNWLWQRMALANVEKALGGATLGDFLHALAGEPKELTVSMLGRTGDRIELDLKAEREASLAPVASITEAMAGTWSDLVSETAGSLTVEHMRASLVSSARQRELDRRIVAAIPSALQLGYLALVGAGLLALPTIRRWWRRLWPQEMAADYAGVGGYVLATMVRNLLFFIVFLPVAALPGLAVHLFQRRRRWGIGPSAEPPTAV